MALYWFVLAPVLLGMISFVIHEKLRAPLLITCQLGFIWFAVSVFLTVKEEGKVLWNAGGYEDGLALSLYADHLAIFLVSMTTIFMLFFIIYSIGQPYFQGQFTFLYMVLQGVMHGLFLSSDLFNIFIFLEVATVVVAILIMINKEKQAIYDGMIYFFVNVIGTSFLLLGIGMIYHTFGLLDIRYIKEAMPLLENPKSMILPFSLMMVTVSLKSALTPLFSWLPKAHGTPSSPPVVSAILSGVYIKTGVYLFIRFNEMYAPVLDITPFFFWVGFITSVVGFMMALGQHDIKLILAYHTVSQVGLIMMGLNMQADIAYWGAIFHILNHGIFKSTLFLTAGIVYEEYGTRDVFKIRGVLRRMPLVGIAMGLSVLGIMGAPFFNGSISKYMIAHGTYDYGMTLLLNLTNLGTIMSFVKYGTMLFGRSDVELTGTTKWPAKLSSFVLGIASLLTGIYAVTLTDVLLNYQVQVDAAEYNQKTIVFFLMVIAGVAFYNGIIKRGSFLEEMGHFELSFNTIITAMVSYFIILVGYLNFVL